MDIQTISTKSLREDFSQVLTAMEKNKKLILIYRSKPIAEIKPIINNSKGMRSFSLKQIKKWIQDDNLSENEQKKIDKIIKNLS